MKSCFTLFSLTTVLSIANVAQAEVRDLNGSATFGNKRLVMHTAIDLAVPAVSNYKIERIAANPDLDIPASCQISLYVPAGFIDSTIEVRNSSGAVVENNRAEKFPIGFSISHDDIQDPNCLSVQISSSAKINNDWVVRAGFGDVFGKTESSLSVAISPVVSFDVTLNPKSGMAKIKQQGDVGAIAVTSFYYQDANDRASGMGATLKEKESPEVNLH